MIIPTPLHADAAAVAVDEAELAARVSVERFHQHLRRQRLASLSGALPSAYLAWLLAGEVPTGQLLTWWLLLLVLDLASFWHAHRGLALESPHSRHEHWLYRQITLQTAACALWSLSFAWVGHSPAAAVSIVVVLVAVFAIGVMGMITYSCAVLSFSVGMWTGPLVLLATSPDPLLSHLAPGVVVLAVSMNFYVWEASRDLLQGLERRLRADALSQSLREAAQRIHHLASHDELTGCLNRREGLARVRSALEGPAPAALMMLDIDHFKRINDSHGHPAGDAVLREVAARLRAELRADDTVVRMGGEEFLVLLLGEGDPGAAAERLRNAIAGQAVPIGGLALPVTASIGWTRALRGETPDAAIARADQVLYGAKRAGRNRALGAPASACLVPSPA